MPQPPVGMTLTGRGKLTVKRSCAVCGTEIDAPNRFCRAHLTGQLTVYEVPIHLSRAVHEAGQTAPIDHPAVKALAEWWKARGVSVDYG